ncbi:MAG: ABC transporter permease subunit [Holophagaceae bacterium]|nr:ABC transporter permease subunit [Holophagaceae bacterium]
MIHRFLDTVWGQAMNLLTAPVRHRRWIDLLVLAALAGTLAALWLVGKEWTAVQRPTVEIALSAWALPKYLLLSLIRAIAAYAISLTFTLVVAYWAAKDPVAERILVPILDILQSVPLLAFLPPVLLLMLTIFPHSNIGLELSAVLLIVTCQAWNMAFSFYQSLKTLPKELEETSSLYGFTWLQKLRWVEVPFATPGLVWNSMVSVANSWFFLMSAEAFRAGNKNFQLPGLGSYMNTAVEQGNGRAQIYAILTMLALVIALDQLVWRPVVAWSQRFQVDDGAEVEPADNWLLRLFRRSRLLKWLEKRRNQRLHRRTPRPTLIRKAHAELQRPGKLGSWVATSAMVAVLVLLALGGLSVVRLLAEVSGPKWLQLLKAGGASLSRVLLSTLLATLWTLPVGLWIGMSPTWSRRLQSIVQVAASFPSSLIFATLILVFQSMGIGLGVSCVLLMVLSTQWYLLFNIIAGAQAIPTDLREAATAYRLSLWKRCWTLYFPAVFPFLVTGWVTATGGAWNASIVTEIVTAKQQTLRTFGLGAEVVLATEQGSMPHLAASALLMAALVVLFNRLVWVPLYRLAETRYALNR